MMVPSEPAEVRSGNHLEMAARRERVTAMWRAYQPALLRVSMGGDCSW